MFEWNKKNIYYGVIDVSDEIDVNKTSASKECDVCYYWYFLNYNECIKVLQNAYLTEKP